MSGHETHATESTSGNRLQHARSAYLRSAAHQPIHWREWSREAFEEAARLDKPVLLDIGAVWCHWCHVMDHESYESEEIARILNARYVAVKVDRDERPDVDARYQKAVQAMTGQGGWPLTAFLLPDGRVFYGGTYFPPRDAQGRPAFSRVLEAVADAYRDRRAEVLENADHLHAHLEEATRVRAGGDLTEETLARAVGRMRDAFDAAQGGFGRAPKFPHPAAVDFLLARRHDRVAQDMAVATLEAMRAGGIYDQLAGGFHRYSVDPVWRVPHFEKMLYDNAGLLRNYARAGRLLAREDFVRTADELVSFLRDVLGRGGPGFGGSQDADAGPGDDGDFFTWTLDELQGAVGDPRLAKLVAAHLGVEPQGDMHHDPARNVLHVAAEAEALAAAFGAPVEQVRRELAEALARMRAARAQRPEPFVDGTRYASWNGMAIQALLEHGGIHGRPEAERLALAALDMLLEEAYEPSRGFARAPGGAYGFLDDNAQMLDALLEAHLATGEARYLDTAREVADLLLARFPHPDGGFVDRAASLAPPAEAAPLARAERPLQDAPSASPNGVALRALLRVWAATGDDRYRRAAAPVVAALSEEAASLALFGGALLLAAHDLLHPPPRVVVAGGDVAAFRRALRRSAWPGATLVEAEAGTPVPASAGAWRGALVCFGDRCLAPAATADELAERLASARA